MPVSLTSNRSVVRGPAAASRLTRMETSPLAVNLNGAASEVGEHLAQTARIAQQHRRHVRFDVRR